MQTLSIARGFGLAGMLALGACGAKAPAVPGPDASADVSAGVRKLDFLWVIDHSTSMCAHQRDLASGAATFLATLNAQYNVDAQMAVVTVQQVADPAAATGVTVKKIGEFNHTAATSFPPNCIEQYRAPCFVDGPSDVTTPSEQCRDGFNFQFTAGTNYQLPATSLLAARMPPDPLADSTGQAQHAGPPYGDVVQHYGPHLAAADTSPINEWGCLQPTSLSQVTNDNGSTNASCRRHCTPGDDATCKNLFGDKAICYTPSGNPASSGCMLPPETADCPTPDKLPSVLHNDQLDLFHCIATVGASSTQQAGFEGGLRSAWMALNPAGPNCPDGPVLVNDQGYSVKNPACQYAQLVRDDATLVIVVVSDDDDCSVDLNLSLETGPALNALLPKEDWGKCQSLGDAVGGNRRLNEGNCLYVKSKCAPSNPTCPDPAKYLCPTDCAATDTACLAAAQINVDANRAVDKRFAPVSDFANRLKSLKADQGKVIFAAISGDSAARAYAGGQPVTDAAGKPVADEAQQAVDAALYYKAKRHNIASKQTPYVCAGAKGEAGYGSRYIEMANAFGQNGYFGNICGDDLGATLDDFAAFLLTRP